MKRFLPILLSAILVFSNLPSALAQDFEKQKEEIDNKISELEEEVEKQKEEKKEFEEELHQINEDMTELEKKIIQSQNKITLTENKINELEKEINRLETKIEETEEEIKEKQRLIKKQKEKLGQTLSFLYENRNVSMLDLIFGSTSIAQLLTMHEFTTIIAQENESIYKSIEKEERALQKKKKELSKNKEEVSETKQEQEELKAELVKEKESLDALMEEFKEEEQQVIERIKQKEREQEETMAMIANYIAEKEEILRKEAEQKRKEEEEKRRQQMLQENFVGEIDENSGLQSPMKVGTYRKSSNFGVRRHPITGTISHHNGIDLAAPHGTPIYAAGNGIVVYSGPARGFGNMIVIAHDNGYYTIYGHMPGNMLYVSEGDYVKAGQHIAGVGSEGDSTGPHLHFEVATGYSGGRFSYVNPLSVVYIP